MLLPAALPRREIRHEPESTTCNCGCPLKRTGEDIAEKLDYHPVSLRSSAMYAAKGAAANAKH
ncbi:helix-turn-helix domain of transposase IS66 family protein [Collimonas fungivorans]|uniref:Helix-turn-helix domain of transposase IS66 family protein n=1 Tax=Collimonas fungivorans TaxID=158899 RepID=A0A127P6S9_9BURK|nr:helix-turn-helix domain of transposase IS66 family protein [Collimonas fungivorans]